MNYKQFKIALDNLQKFIEKDLQKRENALQVFSGGYFHLDICDKFIDDYISLLETAVGDNSNWVSWFVFENSFGRKELAIVTKSGKSIPIKTAKQLYEICIKENYE